MQLSVLYLGKPHAFEIDQLVRVDPIEYVCSQAAAAVGIEAGTFIPFTLLFDGKPLDDITQLSEGNTIVMTPNQGPILPTIEDFFQEDTKYLSGKGDGFLAHHTWLTTIILPEESDVEDTCDDFLKGCSGLTTIDLSGLIKVKYIGDGFLAKCTSLTTITLPEENAVEDIGNNFLMQCSGLTTIDLSGLSSVRNVGDGFLAKCTSLETITLPQGTALQKIGNDFLWECF